MRLYDSLLIDETGVGKRYGARVQIGPSFSIWSAGRRERIAVFECDCGQVSIVKPSVITRGIVTACNRCAHPGIHGRHNTPEYFAWRGMITRCCNRNDKAYYRYGGRGIRLCDEWRNSFQAFFDHIGPRPTSEHSIDRIDNDGHYEPGNVRWATRDQQRANRRGKLNPLRYELNGELKSIYELTQLCQIGEQALRTRLARGWPIVLAMSAPIQIRTTNDRDALAALTL